MEEIIIEGKKYIPSKQAAKLTGYAKDYVGQLSREGRIPARLVGRSWYVLESAIKDHRFGNQEKDIKKAKHIAKSEISIKKDSVSVSDTWDKPQYESAKVETLPSLQKDFLEDSPEKKHSDLHSIWGEWFEHIASNEAEEHSEPEINKVIASENNPTEDEPPLIETIVSAEMDMPESHEINKQSQESVSTSVPLHLMRNLDTDAIEQQISTAKPVAKDASILNTSSRLGKYAVTFQVVGILLATVSILFAILGSGYVDTYLTSYNPVSSISGVTVYNK